MRKFFLLVSLILFVYLAMGFTAGLCERVLFAIGHHTHADSYSTLLEGGLIAHNDFAVKFIWGAHWNQKFLPIPSIIWIAIITLGMYIRSRCLARWPKMGWIWSIANRYVLALLAAYSAFALATFQAIQRDLNIFRHGNEMFDVYKEPTQTVVKALFGAIPIAWECGYESWPSHVYLFFLGGAMVFASFVVQRTYVRIRRTQISRSAD